ncbi:MAG TPA: hypothetical protein VE127_11880 [Solirubrobacteraceae bacterium]|nr:hypothetical protein [Solirubrobacteraceae bacterium]
MRTFKSTRARLLIAVAAIVTMGLTVFAGLAASGTKSPAAAQYAPQNRTLPSISGSAKVGSTLKASSGTWLGGVTSYDYQWQRCDEKGANCSDIAGAGADTYKLTQADAGHALRVAVTAHNADGTGRAVSKPSAAVSSSGGGSSSGGSVGVGSISPPTRLLIDKWQFTPSRVTRGTQTVTARIHVGDTNGNSVSGVRVWATAIPYNQVSAEQGTTGSDGYVTLNFRVESGFPANPGRQEIMAMLIRATDPNGSTLAGKSTRRVVSLTVNLH